MAPSSVQIPPAPTYNQLTASPATLLPQVLSELALPFTEDELTSYAERRKYGLSKYSIDWIDRALRVIWECTNGSISKETIDTLRLSVLKRYRNEYSHIKVLSFAKAFLKFLTKARLDTRYHAFEIFLERPRAIKPRNNVTSRIVTKEDIENVLAHIQNSERNRSINRHRTEQYTAFVLFGAYTGQRSVSTIARLSVGQCREAIELHPQCLLVKASQDKIHMEHYVPLHPFVIGFLRPLFNGKKDAEPLFEYNSLQMWMKRQRIPMSRFKGQFVLGDLRKFAEQHGDVIQWDQSNRAYIMTHGVTGIEWKHYKHPLPETVYDIYMRYWKDVTLK